MDNTKTRTELLFDPVNRKNHSRGILFGVVLIILSVLTTFVAGASTNKNIHMKLAVLKTASVGLQQVANPIANPGITLGAECDMNVILLIDRSGSIHNNANAIKQNIGEFYDTLSSRAQGTGLGSKANVLVDAFGTYSIEQNGPAPQNYTGLTGASWLGSVNIADTNTHSDPTDPNYPNYPMDYRGKTNLEYQKSVVNSIYYNSGDQTMPYDPALPNSAYRGYFGPGTYKRSSSGSAGTNWDDAFISAAQQIRGLTGPDPTVRGDKDFDLVIMVTDGVTTKSDGPDHIAQSGEDSLAAVNPLWPNYVENQSDPEDLSSAITSIDSLRTGAAFVNQNGDPSGDSTHSPTLFTARPPVNVVGILAGDSATDTTALQNMDTVFGENSTDPDASKNWYSVSDFSTGLGDALAKAVSGVGCIPPHQITTGITLTAQTIPAGITSVVEGGSVNIMATITNSGVVPLDGITLTAGGAPVGLPKTVLAPGESMSVKTNMTTTFGTTDSTINYPLYVGSKAVTNGNPLLPGSTATPQASTSLTFNVTRVAMPS